MTGLVRCNRTVLLAQHAAQRPAAQPVKGNTQHARRSVLAAIIAVQGLALAGSSTAETEAAPKAPSSMSIEISMAPKGVSEYMKQRDESMDFKCKGGMFDCDGDRREFAKKQWEDFQERGGRKKDGPKSY